MVRPFVLLILFCCAVFCVYSQGWYKGIVYLNNGGVVSGEIAHTPGTDHILLGFGDEEPAMVLPCFRITSFSFYDDEAELERKFISLRTTIGAAKPYYFYEVVTEGALTVVRKQLNLWFSLRDETIEFDYYILNNGEVIPIHDFKDALYPSLKSSSTMLSDFAKKNKINPARIRDAVRFIEYYNEVQSGVASAR